MTPEQLQAEWLKRNKPTICPSSTEVIQPHKGKLKPTHKPYVYDSYGRRIYENLDSRINLIQDETTFNYGA
jgi:hypothetical protein